MPADALRIFTDGGARGNPGPAAIGVVIEVDGRIVKTISRTIGVATNNQAEYQAVYAALEYARQVDASAVDILCDSELVARQLRGEYKVKNKTLGPWFVKIQSLINQIGRVRFINIPREQNATADRLVNEALDASSDHDSRPSNTP